MAVRTWAQTLGMAAGAAFLAAASQLGVGSGLGLLRWDGDFTSRDAWHTQLTWLAFLTALATVAGAAAAMWAPAGFLGTGTGEREARRSRALLCAAAAVGAIAVIPIGTRPAYGVHLPESGSASHAAIVAMLFGALVGLAVAYATLTVPAVAGNVVTYAIWLWIAALASSLWSLDRSTAVSVGPPTVQSSAGRLGLIPPGGGWTAMVLLLGMPAVIAFGAASVSRFGGGGRLAVAGAGAAGPALVAGAYVIGGRGDGTQNVAYWCALGGVAVGVAVSAFVALARRTPLPEYPRSRYPADGYGRRPSGDDSVDGDRPRHALADDSGEEASWDGPDGAGADEPAAWYPRGTHAAGSVGLITSAGRMEPAGLERARVGDHTSAATGDGQPDDTSGADPDRPAPSWYESGTGRDSEPAGLAGAALAADLWSAPASTTDPASTRDPASTTDPASTAAPASTIAPASTTDTVDPWPGQFSAAPSAPVEDLWSTPAQPTRWDPPSPSPSSRDRSSIFESAPAPEVPTAPASRNRTGFLFDAPPQAGDGLKAWDPGVAGAGSADDAPTSLTGESTAGWSGTSGANASLDGTGPYGARLAGLGASGADLTDPNPSAAYPAGTSDAQDYWSGAEPVPAWGDPDTSAEVAPAGSAQPAWAEHLSGAFPVADPEPAPTGKQGRRGRRKGEATEPPVVPAKDAEYVDWFKDLRGSGRSAEKS